MLRLLGMYSAQITLDDILPSHLGCLNRFCSGAGLQPCSLWAMACLSQPCHVFSWSSPPCAHSSETTIVF